MQLSDLESPSPDWDLVLVYSDYLEDQGQEVEAQALRWLHQFDHWPLRGEAGNNWIWYVDGAPSLPTGYFVWSRYHPKAHHTGLPLVLRATLPFALNSRAVGKARVRGSFPEAVTYFYKLFRPVYTDPTLRPSLYALTPYTPTPPPPSPHPFPSSRDEMRINQP